MKKEKNDYTIKIFALIIAVILWSYVINEKNPDEYRKYRNIQVEYLNTEYLDREGLVIMEPKDMNITVTVVGKKSELIKFSPKSIKASVDLKGYDEGEKKVPINVYLEDDNIKISSVEPREALFKFDKYTSREKPITLKVNGKLQEGNVLGDYKLSKESVTISGPRTWLNQVSAAVVNVDVDKQSSDISGMYPVVLVDDEGKEVRGIEMDTKNVDIEIPVYKHKNVSIKENIISSLGENYEIDEVTFYPSSVELIGEDDLLNLQEIKMKPVEVKQEHFEESKEKIYPVVLELPNGISLKKEEKIEMKVKVKQVSSKRIEFPTDKLTVTNLNDSYEVDLKVKTPFIELLLKGDKDILDSIDLEDIKGTVDLANVNVGYTEVLVTFDKVEGANIVETTPHRIEVYVKEKTS